ncbi:hypothetical protein H696_06391, partial [Fonticula alba]
GFRPGEWWWWWSQIVRRSLTNTWGAFQKVRQVGLVSRAGGRPTSCGLSAWRPGMGRGLSADGAMPRWRVIPARGDSHSLGVAMLPPGGTLVSEGKRGGGVFRAAPTAGAIPWTAGGLPPLPSMVSAVPLVSVCVCVCDSVVVFFLHPRRVCELPVVPDSSPGGGLAGWL